MQRELAILAAEVLGPSGPLAAKESYEHRPEQLTMAAAVARALEDATVLVCEAGTGIGKTLAYLVPAILAGQRIVISTATKALQDQIVSRDLPALRAALGTLPEVAVAKGLGNYVCLRRLREARIAAAGNASLSRGLPVVERWVERSVAGDIAELEELAEDDPLWSEIVSSSDTRVGHGCAHHDACFVTRMRKGLSSAQIVIANHHLFFADLALKARAGPQGEARASVLPPYDAVIFDEAHRIEDIACTFFGARVSSAKVGALLRDADRTFGLALDEDSCLHGLRILDRCRDVASRFFQRLRRLGGERAEGRVRFVPEDLDRADRETYAALDDTLDVLESYADAHAVSDGMEVVRRRTRGIRDDLAAIVEPATHHVGWLETRRDQIAIGASVTDVGPLFRSLVVGRLGGVVLTSATLTTVPIGGTEEAGSFSFLRKRLGLDGAIPVDVDELELGSPFDYAERALLYVPRDLPDVSEDAFLERAAERAATLVDLVGGGAFVLTTSARAMRFFGSAIARLTGRDVMVQGDGPKVALLERFRAHGHAVLVATMSYWEGVDVPGDALRLVIMDKLPFAVPTDPLVVARCAALERDGIDPFLGYTVPEAAITLKQGIGRLLRTRRDRGIVAVFDHRLTSRRYGSKILERLPLQSRTEDLDEVRRFWAELVERDRRASEGLQGSGEDRCAKGPEP